MSAGGTALKDYVNVRICACSYIHSSCPSSPCVVSCPDAGRTRLAEVHGASGLADARGVVHHAGRRVRASRTRRRGRKRRARHLLLRRRRRQRRRQHPALARPDAAARRPRHERRRHQGGEDHQRLEGLAARCLREPTSPKSAREPPRSTTAPASACARPSSKRRAARTSSSSSARRQSSRRGTRASTSFWRV